MIARRSQGVIFLAVVMMALVLALGGCGRKGSPKPPAGKEANYTYPETYPKQETVGAVPAGQDPQETRGPLSIFEGTEEKKPAPADPNAEPESILVLPREDHRIRRRNTPNVLPDSRTRQRTF